MKTTNSHIEEEVKKTLASLNGLAGASPRPFFYTRLRARMERSEPVKEKVLSLRPAYQRIALGVAAALIVFNIFTASLILSSGSGAIVDNSTEQTFLDEYYPALTTIDNLEQNINQ
jgi:hypothetical protein